MGLFWANIGRGLWSQNQVHFNCTSHVNSEEAVHSLQRSFWVWRLITNCRPPEHSRDKTNELKTDELTSGEVLWLKRVQVEVFSQAGKERWLRPLNPQMHEGIVGV